MLVIRLSRTGKTNAPQYRLVVADQKRAVKGKYLEIVGHYNPISSPKEFVANKDRILKLISQGAQVSDTAHNLLCQYEILPKNQKRKITYARKKAVDAEKTSTPETKEQKSDTAEEVKSEEVASQEETASEVVAEETKEQITDDTASEEVEAETKTE